MALGDKGETDLACRIAAEAWSAIRLLQPQEAERLNGALHYLTRPVQRKKKESTLPEPQQLDVRTLPPPQRHALIFDTCSKLPVGNATAKPVAGSVQQGRRGGVGPAVLPEAAPPKTYKPGWARPKIKPRPAPKAAKPRPKRK